MILFRSYAVHSIDLSSIRSTLVIFGPFFLIWSFCPLWLYLVHFGPMQFTLVHFSPITFILSTSVLFSWLWSYSVLIRPLIRSILSTLVLFSSLRPIRSYSVHFGSIQFYSVYFSPIWSTLSTLILFGPIRSTLVYIGPISSILSTSVLFDPVWSYSFDFTLSSVHSDNFSPFGPVCSTSVPLMHSFNFCALR